MKHLRLLPLILLFGCTTIAPDPAPEPASSLTWRVVSYNIRHGRGMDDRLDLERTAAVLRRVDPDIVALQEVDERVERSGGVDQAARLGELLDMNHAFGAFMDYQGGRYGLAILSRCPIVAIDSVRLTEGNEPRVALAITATARDGSALKVVNVHFDWVQDDGFRYTQAAEVAAYLDAVAGSWILAGDLNDQPGSRTLELFRRRAAEAAKPDGARFTFPADEPIREIDFIFVAPPAEWVVRSVQVVDETVASDHRPVLAEVSGAAANAARACG